MAHDFVCDETQELLKIFNYKSSKQPLKFKAKRNGLPVVLSMTPLPKNISTKCQLDDMLLCPGYLESELENLNMFSMDQVFIEMVGPNIVYRSRQCQQLMSEYESVCKQCLDLFRSKEEQEQGIDLAITKIDTGNETKPIVNSTSDEISDDYHNEDSYFYGEEEEDVKPEVSKLVTLKIMSSHKEERKIKEEKEGNPNLKHGGRKNWIRTKTAGSSQKVHHSVMHSRCCFCDYNFASEIDFKLHDEENHLQEGVYFCPEEDCTFSDPTRKEVMDHYADNHQNTGLLYCDHCEHAFFTRSFLQTHMKNVHGIEVSKETCPICKEVLPKEKRVDHHLRMVHIKGMYRCTAGTGGKNAYCDMEQLYKTKEELNAHKAKFHNIQDINTCSICGETFSRAKHPHFIRHIIEHEQEQRYECEQCDKIFVLKFDLVQHTKLVHERQLMCSQCPKTFPNNKGLKSHILRAHTEKSFTCETCGMKFSEKVYLNRHSVVHTNIRRHICKFCGKGFKLKKTLNPHLRLHTGQFFYCEFCNKGFAQKCNLKLHIRKNHKQELALKA